MGRWGRERAAIDLIGPDGLGRAMFSGEWRIVRMPGLDQDYLELSPDPMIRLARPRGDDIEGEYRWGASQGRLFGMVEEGPNDRDRLVASFEGDDEGDFIHGIITAEVDGRGRLYGEWRIHAGDIFGFVGEPRMTGRPKAKPRRRASRA